MLLLCDLLEYSRPELPRTRVRGFILAASVAARKMQAIATRFCNGTPGQLDARHWDIIVAWARRQAVEIFRPEAHAHWEIQDDPRGPVMTLALRRTDDRGYSGWDRFTFLL